MKAFARISTTARYGTLIAAVRRIIPVSLALCAIAAGCESPPTAPFNDAATRSPGALLDASGGGVLHSVSVAGNDLCSFFGKPNGCDANFSLVANQWADGSVTGQWEDAYGPDAVAEGFSGSGMHIAIDCLVVNGNDAVVGGTITKYDINPAAIGVRVVTRAVDNGTSVNDAPDQISLTWPTGQFDAGPDCGVVGSEIPLAPLQHGQVRVR